MNDIYFFVKLPYRMQYNLLQTRIDISQDSHNINDIIVKSIRHIYNQYYKLQA